MALSKLLSLVALAVTLVPCLIFYLGKIDQTTMNGIMLGGTIFWFIVTPLWMGRDVPVDADQVQI
jgi:hypothetical protein